MLNQQLRGDCLFANKVNTWDIYYQGWNYNCRKKEKELRSLRQEEHLWI